MKVSDMQSGDGESGKLNVKLLVIKILVIVVVVIYALHLYSMQIGNGEYWMEKAVKLTSKPTIIDAKRGEIYARDGKDPIVVNTDSFVVEMRPGEIPEGQYDTVATKLADYLGIPKNTIDKKTFGHRSEFNSIEIKINVPLEVISNIAENINDMPGVSWRNKPIRTYKDSGSISHILGYVGNISMEELKLMNNEGYSRNYVVGKSGIEKQYDKLLQGVPGSETRVRDVQGRYIDEKPTIVQPQMGKNLVLTIDTRIQKLAEKALGERVGSIVVLKPSNGEVLAMVSYPYFDSNIFSSENYAAEYNRLINSPNNPMLNRSVASVYPPASTFKTIMTTAILSEKAFPPDQLINCPGNLWTGDRYANCHKKTGHGKLNLKNALAQSCDVYYWIVGRDHLGVDIISSYAMEFGYGQSLDIDLPTQASGFVPTAQWKQKEKNVKWTDGDTINISIGQGDLLVTPLHVADMMAMVCNSGTIYKPHLLKEVRDPNTGDVIQEIEPEVLHQSTVDKSVWRTVQEYLRYMITDGSAQYPMANKKIKMAGKTGTAEAGYTDNHWHAWMVVYGPYDAPVEEQVVVVTIVEAVNTWEWWAPYATNIVMQGIFENQTYEESIRELGFAYMDKKLQGGGASQTTQATETVEVGRQE